MRTSSNHLVDIGVENTVSPMDETDRDASSERVASSRTDVPPTRRRLLRNVAGVGTVTGLAALAGCMDGDGEGPGAADDETETGALEDADDDGSDDQDGDDEGMDDASDGEGDGTEDADDGDAETSDDGNGDADDGETAEHADDDGDDVADDDDAESDETTDDTDEESDDETDKSEDDSQDDDSDDDADESDDSDDTDYPTEPTVDFLDCAHVEIAGRFEDGDVAFASTGFYEDGLYGNTALEDGFSFGNDVEAPFEGTVVMTVGEGRDVSVNGNEITVTIPEYGTDGPVVTGVTTDPEDAATARITHENPLASDCLEELETEVINAEYTVEILETNAPVDAGAVLEVTTEIQNVTDATDAQEVYLLVGEDGEIVARETVELDGGASKTITIGYETADVVQDVTFPVHVETADDADSVDVTVHGTG